MTVITLGPDGDTYTAAVPGDAIYGVGGNDTLTASAGGNALTGGDGDDVLIGRAGNDTLTGDGDSTFFYHNIIKGFGGDDVIATTSWYDEVDAGGGDDYVYSSAQTTNQVINGGAGNDALHVASLIGDNDPVNFTMGATLVFVVAGINGAYYMNFENLDVTLGTGSVTAVGGDGNDRILFAYMNNSNATVAFDAGFVRTGGGDDTVAFNGLTRVGSGIERLDGGTGTDRLNWTTGDAAIGDLTINSANGNMVADGVKFATFAHFEQVGVQTFDAITGTFDYVGFSGVDSMYVGAQSSTINTLGGDDYVTLNAGTGVINGGAGNDVLQIGYPDSENATLHGGQGDDTVIGGSGVNWMYGDDGDDTVIAANSHAQVYGGNGNDALTMNFNQSQIGAGTARVDGGGGQDVLILTLLSTTTPVTLDLSTATVTLDNGCLITGIEGFRMQSGSGADSILASNDARGTAYNTLDGGFGNDTLTASANGAYLNGSFGIDVLRGAAGNDSLNGGYGIENDTLRGAAGNDTLIGAAGRDLLIGGSGADHFTMTGFYAVTATTRVLIGDFSHAQHDKIDLAMIDAVIVPGSLDDQAFNFIGTAEFSNVAGQLRYEIFDLAGKAHDYTLVSCDMNGDTIVDFSFELKGLYDLQATDFVL